MKKMKVLFVGTICISLLLFCNSAKAEDEYIWIGAALQTAIQGTGLEVNLDIRPEYKDDKPGGFKLAFYSSTEKNYEVKGGEVGVDYALEVDAVVYPFSYEPCGLYVGLGVSQQGISGTDSDGKKVKGVSLVPQALLGIKLPFDYMFLDFRVGAYSPWKLTDGGVSEDLDLGPLYGSLIFGFYF